MTTDFAALAAELSKKFDGVVEVDRPLARLTTYRLGGPAAVYLEPAGSSDIEALGAMLKSAGGSTPVLVLGRGSNTVISDRGWPGVVVRLPAAQWSWIAAAEGDGRLSAGAATSLPLVANWAARRGLSGAEFLVAIPGSIGGAVRMNAGAHGRQMGDCLVSARVFDLDRLQTEDHAAELFRFSYRHSNLTARQIVLDATLRLEPADVEWVRDRMESYRRHRAVTQPGAVQNAGSVFKNPAGDHAGRLVEAAGLKGFRVGGAAVAQLHANFFVADEGATAQDVYDLVGTVRARVKDEFGVDLTPEIRFVGEFRNVRGADSAGPQNDGADSAGPRHERIGR
jgi:UDP-N-acetylmuramate dehydrogenase